MDHAAARTCPGLYLVEGWCGMTNIRTSTAMIENRHRSSGIVGLTTTPLTSRDTRNTMRCGRCLQAVVLVALR
eukprot:6191056-Pleurochrysis_carterae.AAC.3